MTYRLAFLTIALGALLSAGCSLKKRVPAVGPGWEIVILASEKTAALGTAISGMLSREIRVVHFEPLFETEEGTLADLDFYSSRKLLFVVGEPEEEDFKKVLKRATGTRTRTSFPGLWIESEPFSAGQTMFILTGPPDAVTESLLTRQDELLAIVENAAVELLVTNMFRVGEHENAREEMMARFGWGVRQPLEWVLDDEYADRNFVRIWHDRPVEQMFVSWEEGRVERTPEEWLQRRDDLVREFYQGDEVVFDWCVAEEGPTPFHGQGAVLKGLWENDKFVIGGPFRAWSFHCPADGRTYFIDFSVYAPDRNKRPLLRVLEALGRTFRCGCVPPPAEASP